MTFHWRCEACGAAAGIEHPGLPEISLVLQANMAHIARSPGCPLSSNAVVRMTADGAVFVPELSPLLAMAATGDVQ